ncbi:short chain dehydrogenase reductase [Niveomyces insectorum RCEF 264]|uniref:Short chain dehydrogenase reductase n=1 Tax=Niveomyces insectorum RCEF 264 TaxID=1081102 RepID=A0A167Q8W4_9HYPO|nr:short chain dehydrogenase reductase [Niveomyces insectorum RCEF 264]
MANITASDLFNVNGMVFVVTGGGTGIGEMMAHALDVNGAAKVFILGRRLDKLQEVASSAKNKTIIPLQCDVASQDDLARAVDVVAAQTPFVNVVIANHGATGPTLDQLPREPRPSVAELRDYFWQTPMAAFTDTFQVNCSAVFYCFVAFLNLLDAGNTHAASPAAALGIDSQFVVTSSINGFSRVPGMGYAYSASKAGVVHMAKLLATNMAGYHIRANVIAPGIYPSAMSKHFLSRTEGQVLPTIVPLERIGTGEDVAGVTLFLCSRAGAYLNGNVVVTDGGRLSILPGSY